MVNRIFLLLLAAMFTAFGLWSIINPVGMTAQLGVEVTGPAAAFEMRGVYGGISIGGALMCLAGVLRSALTRPALWFVLTYMGGYVIGRGASLIAGDPAPGSNWMFAGFELSMALIAAFLLWRQK